jgi:hypothetical protein
MWSFETRVGGRKGFSASASAAVLSFFPVSEKALFGLHACDCFTDCICESSHVESRPESASRNDITDTDCGCLPMSHEWQRCTCRHV